MSEKLEIIEELCAVQMLANKLDSPLAKRQHARLGINLVGANSLVDRQLYVAAAQVFAFEPDDEATFRVLKDVMFIANLREYAYVTDPDIPMDSLMLNFVQPDVLLADEAEARLLRTMRLQVPVLAIDSCFNAKAA